MQYEYVILTFHPSRFMRRDQAAAGVVVRKDDALDIRIPWQEKLRALMPTLTPDMVFTAGNELNRLAQQSPDELWNELPTHPFFRADTSSPGWFEADSPEEYERQVGNILRTQVLTPACAHGSDDAGMGVHRHEEGDTAKPASFASSAVRTARKALDMSMTRFGAWLADRIGKDRPFPHQRIHEWEKGAHEPRKEVLNACLEWAAPEWAARIAARLRGIVEFDDLTAVRVKASIEDEFRRLWGLESATLEDDTTETGGNPLVHLDFPEIPDTTVVWRPFYIEPVAGSGERIAVGVGFQDERGIRFERVLSKDRIGTMFGRYSEHIAGLVSLLESELSRAVSLEDFVSPCSGIHAGQAHRVHAESVEQILPSTMAMVSAFGRH